MGPIPAETSLVPSQPIEKFLRLERIWSYHSQCNNQTDFFEFLDSKKLLLRNFSRPLKEEIYLITFSFKLPTKCWTKYFKEEINTFRKTLFLPYVKTVYLFKSSGIFNEMLCISDCWWQLIFSFAFSLLFIEEQLALQHLKQRTPFTSALKWNHLSWDAQFLFVLPCNFFCDKLKDKDEFHY